MRADRKLEAQGEEKVAVYRAAMTNKYGLRWETLLPERKTPPAWSAEDPDSAEQRNANPRLGTIAQNAFTIQHHVASALACLDQGMAILPITLPNRLARQNFISVAKQLKACRPLCQTLLRKFQHREHTTASTSKRTVALWKASLQEACATLGGDAGK